MLNLQANLKDLSKPLLVMAIHNGHLVMRDSQPHLSIDEFRRLHEEDPYTEFLADIASNTIVNYSSRFEVDINRPRDRSIYKQPDWAWGLKVWQENVPEKVYRRIYKNYDDFYGWLKQITDTLIDRHGYFLVYDIHTYNHKRQGPAGPEANPAENPEINIGTGKWGTGNWRSVSAKFCQMLSDYKHLGRSLDVRENIKFKGGFLSDWVHKNYGNKAFVLAIEFKKFFMDEWSGAVDIMQLKELKKAIAGTVPEMLKIAKETQPYLETSDKYERGL